MRYGRYTQLALRVGMAIAILLAVLAVSFMVEQRRTQAEMGSILSDLFSQELSQEQGRNIQIVLQRDAENPWKSTAFRRSLLLDPRSSFAKSSRTTRASFFLSNLFWTDIHAKLHLPGGAQAFFFSRREAERMKPGDFQKRFPNNVGYFVVSQAGLNPGRTEAILYIEHHCPGLCGGGAYILVRKVNGVWRLVDQHNVWVS